MTIRAIYTSESSNAPLMHHTEVEVIEGAGIKDDRYATGRGLYSGMQEWDAQLTIISERPFLELEQQHSIVIDPKELRRNLVVDDVNLEDFIGKEFRIGAEVLCKGRKAWPPCSHIVEITGRKEIARYLSKQCGIGVDVLKSGRIQLGDRLILA